MSDAPVSIEGLIRGLNPPQKEAVMYRGGPLLVLAGAGSGKTRVITVRIAKLIEEGVPAAGILAITFTNKAAAEMRERVAGVVGATEVSQITLSTFHSLGLMILQRDGHLIGIDKPITILDAADQTSLVRRILKRLNVDPNRHDPRVFLSAISDARHAQLTPDAIGRQPGRRLTGRVFAEYEESKRAFRVIDFDDLLLAPLKLFKAHPECLKKWQERYAHILVDEFQDTNVTQLELVRTLLGPHQNICVVGDDDQSIYGWRGASISNILEFERHFADARVITLDQNYRSTGHILGAANAVIAKNTARKVKSLWTQSPDGEAVRVVACRNEAAEASFVADEIMRRVSAGARHEDIGVLFRTSAQARPLEESLRMLSIPYRLVGAFAFFERKEVKDILAYLRVAVAPSDRTNFLRAVAFPPRGIGATSIERFFKFMEREGLSLSRALDRVEEVEGLRTPIRNSFIELRRVLIRLRAQVRGGASPSTAGAMLIEELGVREVLIRDTSEGPGGKGRWENVKSLLTFMERYETRRPESMVKDFLQHVTLEANQEATSENSDAVTLMTLHAAKGLEWPVCFMVGCQEGLLPHQRTIEGHGDLSEERRLFYVGLTRAREVSLLTYAKKRRHRGSSVSVKPSRFIGDIPNDHRRDDSRVDPKNPENRDSTKKRFAALKSFLDS